MHLGMITRLLSVVLTIPVLISAQILSDCHPFPGAIASDVLQLISNNFGADTTITCTQEAPTHTLTLGGASFVTKCTNGPGTASFTADDIVRRVLTVVGKCALSDVGSVSGYYMADDGAKTCYLYPGQEGRC